MQLGSGLSHGGNAEELAALSTGASVLIRVRCHEAGHVVYRAEYAAGIAEHGYDSAWPGEYDGPDVSRYHGVAQQDANKRSPYGTLSHGARLDGGDAGAP